LVAKACAAQEALRQAKPRTRWNRPGVVKEVPMAWKIGAFVAGALLLAAGAYAGAKLLPPDAVDDYGPDPLFI
jgi:hypothetical protein